MIKNYLYSFVSFLLIFAFSMDISAQQSNFTKLYDEENAEKPYELYSIDEYPPPSDEFDILNPLVANAYPNPLLLNFKGKCSLENLNFERFGREINISERMAFCEAVQKVSVNLNRSWSPALQEEIREVWRAFVNENVKIYPMKKGVSSKIIAMAGAFTENQSDEKFNAAFYLRPERAANKSFFLVFMHELRHVFDAYSLWKHKSGITQAEMEKRAFRIMGKIYQESPEKRAFWKTPTFWKNDWKDLPPNEVEKRREDKIVSFMRRNSLYKKLLVNPEKYWVGYKTVQPTTPAAAIISDIENKNEKLPVRADVYLSEKIIPQNIKEISFTMEKSSGAKSPEKLLEAALKNEKNLYYKMDNFVYDQNLQLQCWKKQKVNESYQLDRSVARVHDGKTLFRNENISSSSSKSTKLPSCVLNFDSIKTDATETFWAAPYLDQMPVQFDRLTTVDGIAAARYTVYQPSMETFNEIAARYPHISPFRAFVGTFWVSIEDSQIIRFAGTSFPESAVTGYQCANRCASYGATAVRQKLASGIWVTTLLNTVAITDKNGKLKPFNYVVKYENYRQGTSDVKILDDVEKPLFKQEKVQDGKLK